MSEIDIIQVRSPDRIADATRLVWEFFDVLSQRYPEMADVQASYIKAQNVSGQLDDFARYFNPPAGDCFLALDKGEAVGIVMIRPRADRDGELNRMYVRESARGKGVGRALCARAIAQARTLGYRALYLNALYRHVEALALYPSMGFQRFTEPDLEGDERQISMRLDLTATADS